MTVAERVPIPDGVKVTLIVQVAPAFKLAPHVLVSEKSKAFAPDKTMLAIERGALPVFCTVTLCGPLEVPTAWLGKARVVVESVAVGAVPVPVKVRI